VGPLKSGIVDDLPDAIRRNKKGHARVPLGTLRHFLAKHRDELSADQQ